MKRFLLTGLVLGSLVLTGGCAWKHPWFNKTPAAPPCGPCGGGGMPPPGAYSYPPPVAPAVPPPSVSHLGPTPDIQGQPIYTQMPAQR